MKNRETRRIFAILLFGIVMLQSCMGAGDMFAEKRKVVGDYFLMSDENDQHSYYLFRKGQSGSLSGPLRAIGWDQHFILVEQDGTLKRWAAFPIYPEQDAFARTAIQGRELLPSLKQAIILRSPREVWEHSPESGSWISRPFS